MESETVSGQDWYGGTTIWEVRYEFADSTGGGETVDYFRTANRYTPPTGPQIASAVNAGGELTLLGIEGIKLVLTITPQDEHQYIPRDFGPSKHDRIFDAFRDEPPAYGIETAD